MTTSTMSDTLRAELVRRGWDPDFVTWGRRVSGDVHGVTLERDGQKAIVRWG